MKTSASMLLLAAGLVWSGTCALAEDVTAPPNPALETVELAQAESCQPGAEEGTTYGWYLDCGRQASWRKDYDTSRRFYEKALALAGSREDRYTASLELARLLSWQHQYEPALERLDALVADYPERPEAKAMKAQVSAWQGYIWSSYRQYKDLYREAPDNYDVRLGLAQTESYLGFYGHAHNRFKALIEDYPERVEPRIQYGQSLAWQGRLLKSKAVLSHANENFPDNAQLKAAYFDTTNYLGKPDAGMLESDTPLLREKRESFRLSRRPYLQASYAYHNENGTLDEVVTHNRFPAMRGFYPTDDSELFLTFMPVLYRSGDGVQYENRYTYGIGGSKNWTDRLMSSGWVGVSHFSNGGNVPVYANAKVSYRVCDFWQPAFFFDRYPIEDSLLSSTGLQPRVGPFARGFVGRVTRNEFWLNNDLLLPGNFTARINYALGFDDGLNMDNNFFTKLEYRLRHNLVKTFWPEWKSTLYADYEGRYWHFEDDRLANGGAYLVVRKFGLPLGSDSANPNGSVKTGGYFSPDHYFYQGFRLGNQGHLLRERITYDVSGVLGFQNISRFGTTLAAGVMGTLRVALTRDLSLFSSVSYDNLTKFRQLNVYSGLRYQF